jgi:pre-mRNA-processing factor 6
VLNLIGSEAQARRGEEAEVDPEQFQDPDNEYGLFAGTTYEQDDEEADKIYQQVDEAMDARRRARRCVSRLSGQSLSLLLTD